MSEPQTKVFMLPGVLCVWCGKIMTGDDCLDQMKAHDGECPEHPLSKQIATLTRRVEDAEKELIRAVSHCEEACLAERRALDRVEELEGLCRDAHAAMKAWGAEEDGVPDWTTKGPNPYEACQRLATESAALAAKGVQS